MSRKLFWTSVPSHDTAIELFDGDWASDLAEVMPHRAHAGPPLFYQDHRPRQAATALGRDGRLEEMTVLELGPLEGAHSYQLEQLGSAKVTAIEANSAAFLRCLVIKNILALDRTTFYLGDCSLYLETNPTRFDLIFACGILYHMEDPIELIKLMARRTDKIFIWSQYYDATYRYANGRKLIHRETRRSHDGLELPVYALTYRKRFRRGFFGGNRPKTHWLTLDGIMSALRHYGFDDVDIIDNDRNGERGPAVTLAARRTATQG